MKAYVFDIEANSFNELVITKTGKILKEVDQIHCLVLIDLNTGEVKRYHKNSIEDTLLEGWAELMSADLIIGHNIISYDLPVLRRLLGESRRKPKVFDTLVGSRLLWPDAQNHPFGGNSLEAWGIKLGELKIEYHGFEAWSQEMEEYCCQDVRVTVQVYQYIAPLLKPFLTACRTEHKVAEILARQQDNGIKIDLVEAQSLIDRLTIEQQQIDSELQTVFKPEIEYLKAPQWYELEVEGKKFVSKTKKDLQGQLKEAGFKKSLAKKAIPGPPRFIEIPFNSNSSHQINKRLNEKYGYVAPLTVPDKDGNGGGNPSITEEELQSLDYPEAKLLFQSQQLNRRLTQVTDWITRATLSRTPGIIHPQINPCGAATSRMTHQQPNQTACPKVITAKREGKSVPLRGFEGRYGWECRVLWGPTKPGWVQVGADASGLELRMLGNRLWPYDKGKYATEVIEGDVHTLNMKAGGLLTRDQSKTCIYALLYGSGNEALGFQICNHMSLSKEQRLVYFAKKNREIGMAFRKKIMNNLPALKKLLDECSKSAERGYLVLLDGRHAPIRSEYSALNTLLQGDGAIVMKVALVLCEESLRKMGWGWGKDFAFMLNAHDEFQLECRPEIAKEVASICVKSIEEAGRMLGVKCPLTGEAKIGTNWAETH